jgi:hypothetical protein
MTPLQQIKNLLAPEYNTQKYLNEAATKYNKVFTLINSLEILQINEVKKEVCVYTDHFGRGEDYNKYDIFEGIQVAHKSGGFFIACKGELKNYFINQLSNKYQN